jgi:hypothetical protein
MPYVSSFAAVRETEFDACIASSGVYALALKTGAQPELAPHFLDTLRGLSPIFVHRKDGFVDDFIGAHSNPPKASCSCTPPVSF